jgi:hypothetical protein
MDMCIKGLAFFYDFSIGIDDCSRSVVFFGVFIVPLKIPKHLQIINAMFLQESEVHI